MIDAGLGAISLAGFAVAAATFGVNLETPIGPGPVPFFSGLAVGVGFGFAVFARHIVWR